MDQARTARVLFAELRSLFWRCRNSTESVEGSEVTGLSWKVDSGREVEAGDPELEEITQALASAKPSPSPTAALGHQLFCGGEGGRGAEPL